MRVCVHDFETLKGTLEEWTGGVCSDLDSDRMSICVSFCEDPLTLVMFFA